MTKNEIPNIARHSLSDLLGEPGGILYSSHETLKPGDVYLLGFNPAGSNGAPLIDSINEMLSFSDNSYLDECWSNGNGTWSAGEAFLQKQVQWLLSELGLNTSEVCASNLIFLQSRSAIDISYSLAKRCWPVHQAILGVVQPKLIIAFGNSNQSPYGYLKAMFEGEEESMPSGHGNWRVKGFHCQIDGRSVYVAGLPHLSRYTPEGKPQVVQWLAKHL
jgi:hypothetical protein